ncbi:hypothetical protein Tco_0897554 [Tanacetum coccineum]
MQFYSTMVSKPLPLMGEPGHITIQSDFFFNKDLEYLRYGRKIGRPALSISKMKAAFYLDVGLEQLIDESVGLTESKSLDSTRQIQDEIQDFGKKGHCSEARITTCSLVQKRLKTHVSPESGELCWSVLTDPEDQVMVEMEIPRSSGVNSQPHAHT